MELNFNNLLCDDDWLPEPRGYSSTNIRNSYPGDEELEKLLEEKMLESKYIIRYSSKNNYGYGGVSNNENSVENIIAITRKENGFEAYIVECKQEYKGGSWSLSDDERKELDRIDGCITGENHDDLNKKIINKIKKKENIQ